MNRRRGNSHWTRLISSLPVLMTAAHAQAQQQSPVLEEVTVTAQRREENLQKVPVSVTAFTGDSLDKLGAISIRDVAARTPNLYYGGFSDMKLSPTSIRGVFSNAGSAGQDPAVGYYVDDVFVGTPVATSMDLFDIERIEILRGPQGTLFGRNTIGGVINIQTARPSQTFDGHVSADVGNYDYRRYFGTVTGPIVPERLAGRVSVMKTDRDGFIKNALLGNTGDDLHNWGARGQLELTGENASILLTVEHTEFDQSPKYFESLVQNRNSDWYRQITSSGLPYDFDPYNRVVYSESRLWETLDSTSGSIRAELDFDDLKLIAISGYRGHQYDNFGDSETSALGWSYDGDPELLRQFSQEIRLASNASGRLDWQLGVYYYTQRTENESFVGYGDQLAALRNITNPAFRRIGSFGVIDLDSYALFGHVGYELSDAWRLQIGARYSEDKKDLQYSQYDPRGVLGGNIEGLSAKGTWNAFTPSASLSYTIDPERMVYGTISRGYKAGGYNDALGSADGIRYDPEFAWNYEVGLKSEWLDRRLRANVAAFYLDWTSIQLLQDNPDTPVYDPITRNGGKAESKGVELELSARVTQNLTLGINSAYTRARYVDTFVPAGAGNPLRKLDRIPYVPEFSVGPNVEYVFAATPAGEFRLFVDYQYRGETRLTNSNDPDGAVDPFGLLNARLSFISSDERWRVALWSENVGDEIYLTRMYDQFSGSNGQKLANLGAPRTYGVNLRFDF